MCGLLWWLRLSCEEGARFRLAQREAGREGVLPAVVVGLAEPRTQRPLGR
jgi:hypothetical protein